jgi:NADH-quinone oxidoreductase subunit K
VTTETLLLTTSAILFAIGIGGVLYRRNPISLLMSIEVMLNAANLLIVLGARVHSAASGQAVALIVLVVAAAEAVIGLAIALALFRDRDRADIDEPAEVHG